MKTRMLLMLVLLSSLLIVTGCLFTNRPRAEFAASPRSGYPPLEVHFDARNSTSPNGPIVAYDWSFGDGKSATGAKVTHTYVEKGIYPVSLTVTDSVGSQASVTHNVQALSLPPVASFDFWPSLPTKDTPVTFDASSSYDPDGVIVSYIWSFGDGTAEEGEYVEHIFPQAGIRYTVRLSVIDDDGVTRSTEKTVPVVGCNTCG